MIIKLPVVYKRVVDGKLEVQKDYLDCIIDTSLASQIRYEAKFPELAKNEDLYGYSKRLREHKELTIGKILSDLKLLYCWLKIDLEFIDFVRLFDMSDKEYVKDLLKAMDEGFKFILNSSAEKN